MILGRVGNHLFKLSIKHTRTMSTDVFPGVFTVAFEQVKQTKFAQSH